MKLKLESGDTLTRRVWLCEGPHGSVVWAHVGRLRPRSANTAISRGALNVEWGQCSQNVDVNGPHHGRYQLMASSSLHCHRLVEWGRHNELEASMVRAVYVHVLRTLSGAFMFWFQRLFRKWSTLHTFYAYHIFMDYNCAKFVFFLTSFK